MKIMKRKIKQINKKFIKVKNANNKKKILKMKKKKKLKKNKMN